MFGETDPHTDGVPDTLNMRPGLPLPPLYMIGNRGRLPLMKKCLAMAILALMSCLPGRGEGREPQVGEAPPPLGLETILQAPLGTQASWAILKGKVVVLEFWATWCGPCIAAFPHLNEMAEQF